MGDELLLLRWLIDCGADEAIGAEPVDRFAAPAVLERRAVPALRVAAAPEPPAPADTLDALLRQWDGMADHKLRRTATHTVRPAGNPAAPIVLIGDAPGSDDDRSGQAWSGPAGQLIDRVFASAGLGREAMLLTTLVPWRPPGNRPLSEAEIQSCRPFIQRLLALVRPRHLILVGTVAVRALTGEAASVRRLRGRWLPVQIDGIQPTVPALALPSTDQWLHNSAAKQQLWSDLLRLQAGLTTVAN